MQLTLIWNNNQQTPTHQLTQLPIIVVDTPNHIVVNLCHLNKNTWRNHCTALHLPPKLRHELPQIALQCGTITGHHQQLLARRYHPAVGRTRTVEALPATSTTTALQSLINFLTLVQQLHPYPITWCLLPLRWELHTGTRRITMQKIHPCGYLQQKTWHSNRVTTRRATKTAL